jgi:hypothetical protein
MTERCSTNATELLKTSFSVIDRLDPVLCLVVSTLEGILKR